MNHYHLYHNEIPKFLQTASLAPELLRLKDVGMNCGCEYTSIPRFQRLAPYSRWDHSLGTALIVWHFTGDPAQAMAGLLHDLATPVFAHVVDFLRGDYLTQEATEAGTREMIEQSPALRRYLDQLRLCVDDVCDYHRYPIADNDSPKLSADRLEYTIGNCLNYGIREETSVRRFYEDLKVGENENGNPELCFQSLSIATDFADAALDCSEIYIADEDRYAMQILSELLRSALLRAVISEDSLYDTERQIIGAFMTDSVTSEVWRRFRALRRIERSDVPVGKDWRRIQAKKRCIDPMVLGSGRVSDLDSAFQQRLIEFQNRNLDYWIRGTEETEEA